MITASPTASFNGKLETNKPRPTCSRISEDNLKMTLHHIIIGQDQAASIGETGDWAALSRDSASRRMHVTDTRPICISVYLYLVVKVMVKDTSWWGFLPPDNHLNQQPLQCNTSTGLPVPYNTFKITNPHSHGIEAQEWQRGSFPSLIGL